MLIKCTHYCPYYRYFYVKSISVSRHSPSIYNIKINYIYVYILFDLQSMLLRIGILIYNITLTF